MAHCALFRKTTTRSFLSGLGRNYYAKQARDAITAAITWRNATDKLIAICIIIIIIIIIVTTASGIPLYLSLIHSQLHIRCECTWSRSVFAIYRSFKRDANVLSIIKWTNSAKHLQYASTFRPLRLISLAARFDCSRFCHQIKLSFMVFVFGYSKRMVIRHLEAVAGNVIKSASDKIQQQI